MHDRCMFFRRLAFVFISLFLSAFSGSDLIGTPAPDWNNDRWIHSGPLRLSQLRGKVILLRFFMESDCPFCRRSAPYLNELHRNYGDKGLVVIGMYTPKPFPRKCDSSTVRRYVDDYGFLFPVAVDDEWSTLRKFWLDRVPDAQFTSVSFLIDKKGIVRYIHPGGAYQEEDVVKITGTVEALLGER